MLIFDRDEIHQISRTGGKNLTKLDDDKFSGRTVDETTLRMIEEARQRFEAEPAEDNSRRFLPQLMSIESLDDKDKMSMIFDMMFAALDTTTYSIFRTLFYLAKAPEAQVGQRDSDRK